MSTMLTLGLLKVSKYEVSRQARFVHIGNSVGVRMSATVGSSIRARIFSRAKLNKVSFAALLSNKSANSDPKCGIAPVAQSSS